MKNSYLISVARIIPELEFNLRDAVNGGSDQVSLSASAIEKLKGKRGLPKGVCWLLWYAHVTSFPSTLGLLHVIFPLRDLYPRFSSE